MRPLKIKNTIKTLESNQETGIRGTSFIHISNSNYRCNNNYNINAFVILENKFRTKVIINAFVTDGFNKY